jgi:hypothetical protein
VPTDLGAVPSPSVATVNRMTDLSNVLPLARNLSLSEGTVDTPEVIASLADLKTAMVSASSGDETVDRWLSQEHMAGGVLSTAATMNRRAELSGKGDPFNRQSRATLIDRYNAWASQLVERIEAVDAGHANVSAYLRQLAAFHADPLQNNP